MRKRSSRACARAHPFPAWKKGHAGEDMLAWGFSGVTSAQSSRPGKRSRSVLRHCQSCMGGQMLGEGKSEGVARQAIRPPLSIRPIDPRSD